MTKFNLLMLPLVQLINLVQDFLSIPDIVKLDSSFCNNDERPLFAVMLNGLTKGQFTELKVSTDLFRWVHSKISNALFVCAHSDGLRVVETEVEMSPEVIKMMMKGHSHVSCQNKEFVSAVLKHGGGEVVSIRFVVNDNRFYDDGFDSRLLVEWRNLVGTIHHQHLPNLTEISFWRDCYVRDNAIVHIAKEFPKLRKVSLVRCRLLTDRSVVSLLTCCPDLEYLKLSQLDSLTDDTLDAMLAQGQGLHIKSFLFGRTNRRPFSLQRLLRLFQKIGSKLTCLDLSSFASDALVKIVSENCSALTVLKLKWTTLANSCLTHLTACTQLTSLSLARGVQTIRFVDVQTVIHSLAHLRDIVIPVGMKGVELVYCLMEEKCCSISILDTQTGHISGELPATRRALTTHMLVDPSIDGGRTRTLEKCFGGLLVKCVGAQNLSLGGTEHMPGIDVWLTAATFVSQILLECCSLDLRKLSLSCAQLSDADLIEGVARKCSNLLRVSLHGCRMISSVGIVAICKSNPKIITFALGNYRNSDVSLLNNDALLGDGISSLRDLSSLTIWNANLIDKVGYQAVLARCKSLDRLWVTHSGEGRIDYCSKSVRRFMVLGKSCIDF
jgi:hypothetical protein